MPVFRIYLRQSASLYYTLDASGNVVTTPVKTQIDYDPEGWEDTETANIRNFTYAGLEAEYAVPYKFPFDGAKILRYIDYTQGPNAPVQIEIEQQDGFDLTYQPYFIGDIDLSASTDGVNFYITPVKELGLAGELRSVMDLDVEIPIDGPEVVIADIEPFTLSGSAEWITAYPTPYVPNTALPWVYYVFNQQDTIGYPITVNQQNYGFTSGQGTPNWMFKTNQPITNLFMSGQVRFTLQNLTGTATTYSVIRRIANTITNTAVSVPIVSAVPLPAMTTIQFTVDVSAGPFNLNTGDDVTFFVGVSGMSQVAPGGPPQSYILSWETGDTLAINYNFTGPGFSTTGLRGEELFKRIIEKLTNGAGTGVSNYLSSTTRVLDTVPNQILWLSGNSIRGIANPTIKTTLSKFLASCNAILCTGFSVEGGVARVEERRRYYDAGNVIISFPDPMNVDIQKAKDYMFKKVSVGYATEATEKVNGRDEYNTTQVRELPGTRNAAELSLISPALASQYTLFNTYVEYTYRNTADSPKDNDTFLLEIETFPTGSGHYPAQTWPVSTVTGVTSGNKSLNLGLTPARMLLRNGPRIGIGVYQQNGETVRFQLAERNPNLQSNLASGLIIEKADLLVSDLGAPFALPYLITATVNSPRNILSLMQGNYGVIRVLHRGYWLSGFPIKVGCKSATLGEYEITLLASPDNDLTQII